MNSMILKSTIVSLALAIGLVFSSLSIAGAATEQQNAVCQGSELKLSTNVSGSCDDVKEDVEDGQGGSKLNTLIAQIINIFSVVVGIVAVIMIIYGGFRYITSGGDANNISTAKNVILYAIIGLIIVALAQIIVKFVLAQVVK